MNVWVFWKKIIDGIVKIKYMQNNYIQIGKWCLEKELLIKTYLELTERTKGFDVNNNEGRDCEGKKTELEDQNRTFYSRVECPLGLSEDSGFFIIINEKQLFYMFG
jgi:hypothetical protein